jgi:hypothetical protein
VAKGGIGGGIAAVLLLALGGAWVFFTRQKRKRSFLNNLNNKSPAYKDDTGLSHAHEGLHYQSKPSKGGEVFELAAIKQVSELPVSRGTHELPT